MVRICWRCAISSSAFLLPSAWTVANCRKLLTEGWAGKVFLPSAKSKLNRVPSSATWISAVDRETGLSLPRQPKWSGRIDLDRTVGSWQGGITLRGQTATHESSASQINEGFVTADLRLAYAWTPRWHLEASLNNVLDKHYQTAFDYNQAGRTVFFNLRYGM